MLKLYSNETFRVLDTAFIIYQDNFIYKGQVIGSSITKLTVQIDAPIYGTMTIYCKSAFHDELTARSAMYARNYQRFMDYKAEIKTLDDLLTFSLTHILAGEEMDELARQAYTARAKELGHPLFQPDTIDPDLLLHAIGRL